MHPVRGKAMDIVVAGFAMGIVIAFLLWEDKDRR
jgi:hypothetical protein